MKNDGTVWAWGWNGAGELGTGSTTDSRVPVRVAGLSQVTSVSAGLFHSVALKVDGTLRTWGWNGAGELGTGSGTYSSTPVFVRGVVDVVSVSAGFWHTLAAGRDGRIWAWGANFAGQLGTGDTQPRRLAAEVVWAPANGVTVSAGAAHSVRIAGGQLSSWGWNVVGQLGLGDTTDRWRPESVPGRFGTVSAGTFHTLATTSD